MIKIGKTTACIRLLCIVTLFGSIATSPASPREGALGIGDPAPALQASEWIQGEPVTEFARDKVYLIEFWATWCGPCVQSIPHLNKIATEYESKGLVVIGQNISEPDESKVKPFVEKMGDKMTYRVALDDKSRMEKGAMATTWLKASGARGIPAAFLVGKDGKIAWIGHPMEIDDSLIEQVLVGTFDLKKAAVDSRQAREALNLGDEIELLYRAGRLDEAEAALNQAAKGFSPEPPDIVLLRARIGFQQLAELLDQQINSKKWDEAEATLEKMSQIVFPAEQGEMAAKEIAMVVAKARFMISTGRGDWDAAATNLKKLPQSDAIETVQEVIARSDDEATSQTLRHMLGRLQVNMRRE